MSRPKNHPQGCYCTLCTPLTPDPGIMHVQNTWGEPWGEEQSIAKAIAAKAREMSREMRVPLMVHPQLSKFGPIIVGTDPAVPVLSDPGSHVVDAFMATMESGIVSLTTGAIDDDGGVMTMHTSKRRGQRVKAMDKCERVTFGSTKLAHVLLEPLLDSPFAVQLTTYPAPRVRDTSGNEAPAATLDFVDDGWLVDMVRMLRDLTSHTPTPFKTPVSATLDGIRLTPQKAASVLGLVINKGEEYHHALEGGWRAGGREFSAKALRDLIAEHTALHTPSRFFGTVA